MSIEFLVTTFVIGAYDAAAALMRDKVVRRNVCRPRGKACDD